MKPTKEELSEIIRLHCLWLKNEDGGKRAVLTGADLTRADLSGANLSWADLTRANLSWADLTRANLSGANLSGANLDPIAAARLSIVPETGAFEGWKKLADETICHLLIPAESPRSNGTERKCRAEFVKVISGEGVSYYDGGKTVYRVGEIVRCDKWDSNRWNTCGGGIHFYITKAEAEAHKF